MGLEYAEGNEGAEGEPEYLGVHPQGQAYSRPPTPRSDSYEHSQLIVNMSLGAQVWLLLRI
jgi:hypothetical protein